MNTPLRLPPVSVVDLGVVDYESVQRLQSDLQLAVAEGRLPGTLLLLEHPPVITLGSRGTQADVAPPVDREQATLPVVKSDRGGAATLHAPGQLVSYPVVPIPRRDLRRFVWSLEEVLIRLLSDLGIAGERSAGRPGLYVDGLKIASVGLRCRRWVAAHGTSVNLSNDLSLFDAIVSCGEAGLRQTSVAALTGLAPDMRAAKEVYAGHFARVFGQSVTALRSTTIADLHRLIAGCPNRLPGDCAVAG